MRKSLFIIVLFAVGWTNVCDAQTATQRLLAESDPAIQAQIRAAYNLQNEAEFFQQLKKLTKMTDDKAELIKQLAIFVVTAQKKVEFHTLQAMIVLRYLEFHLELNSHIAIRVLAPYLDSENEDLRDFAEMRFVGHDSNEGIVGKPPLGSVNFHEYMEYVRARLGRNKEIPAGFIEYLYKRDPGKALLVFARASGVEVAIAELQAMHEAMQDRRPVQAIAPEETQKRRNEKRQREMDRDVVNKEKREFFLAEHIVSNAIWLKENVFPDRFEKALPEAEEQLTKLAKHHQWWARLYVAEIMRRHIELLDREIVGRLTDDSNALVAKAALEVAESIEKLDEAKRANWIVKHGTEMEKLVAQEEQRIQERIKRICDELKKQQWLDSPSYVAAIREVQELKDIGTDLFEIVKQIAIFAAKEDESQTLYAGKILELLDLPPQIVIRVLAPYLNADNKNLRSFVRNWFQSYDNGGRPGPESRPLQPVKYEDYVGYVRGQNSLQQMVPTGFVEYMYEQSPERGLLVFAYAFVLGEERREIELSVRIVNDTIWLKENKFTDRFEKALPQAKAELVKPANHPQWWARLYVAEIMRRHPDLRDPDVMEKLREDGNELVRKSAKGEVGKGAAKPLDKSKEAAAVPLVAPRDVEARTLGGGNVRVDWQASAGATSYDVLRRQPDSETDFTTIATDVKGTTYTDYTGESGILYEYRIIANGPEEAQPKAAAADGP